MRTCRLRILRFTSLLLVVSLLVPGLRVLGKGRPDKVMLTGPGIMKPIEISDRQSLDVLGLGGLEDLEKGGMDKAPSVGAGYDLVRYIEEPGAKPIAFDHVRYFPKAADGHSYVYYVGIVNNNSWSDLDNKWFTVNPQGQAVLDRLLAKYALENTTAQAELAAVSKDCKVGPAVTDVKALGLPALSITDTAWATGFAGPNATLKIAADTARGKPDDHGWAHPVNWIVSQKLFYKITLWATNLEDNSPVWFELPGQQPSTMLTLTPKLTPASKRDVDYLEFASTVYLPKAGCYEMQVLSSQRPISITFAAGQ